MEKKLTFQKVYEIAIVMDNHLAKYGSPLGIEEVRGGPQGNFGSVRANGWEEMVRKVDAYRANRFVYDAERIILH